MQKSQNIPESFRHALRGIAFAFAGEKNFKVHTAAALIAIALGFYFQLSAVRWALLLLQIAMVITVELINSAFERTVDMIVQEYHIEAKRIKDMAAGAVLVISMTAVINGLLIFFVR